jgi:hypothetical protein
VTVNNTILETSTVTLEASTLTQNFTSTKVTILVTTLDVTVTSNGTGEYHSQHTIQHGPWVRLVHFVELS